MFGGTAAEPVRLEHSVVAVCAPLAQHAMDVRVGTRKEALATLTLCSQDRAASPLVLYESMSQVPHVHYGGAPAGLGEGMWGYHTDLDLLQTLSEVANRERVDLHFLFGCSWEPDTCTDPSALVFCNNN